MSESITITLSLPSRVLSPNGRHHWRAKAKAVKAYRSLAWLTTQQSIKGAPLWKSATVVCHFYFAQRRGRDGDNLLASMKSAFDGIRDAGLIKNDVGLTHLPVVIDYDKARPRVEVTLTRVQE